MRASLRLLAEYFAWGVAIALSYGLIHLSLIPGRLGDVLWGSVLFLLVLLNVAIAWAAWTIVGLAVMVGVVLGIRQVYLRMAQNLSEQRSSLPTGLRSFAQHRTWLRSSACICLALSCTAVILRLPRRLALAHSRAGFYAAASSSEDRQTMPQHLGLYTVQQQAKDSRGGVYFVLDSDPSVGLWSEGYTVSRGYAYQPNVKGSPFGDEAYSIWHLFGDWYEFQAIEPISR